MASGSSRTASGGKFSMEDRPGCRVGPPYAFLGEVADQLIVLGDSLPAVQGGAGKDIAL